MIKAYTLFNYDTGIGSYFYAMETFLGLKVIYNFKNKVITDKNDTIIIGDAEALKYFDFKNYFRTILFIHDIFPYSHPEYYNYSWGDELKNEIKEYIEENQKYPTQRLIIFNSEYTKNDFETYFNCKVKNPLILYPTPIKIYDLNLEKEYDLITEQIYTPRKNPDAVKSLVTSHKFKTFNLYDYYNNKLTDADLNIVYNKARGVYLPSYLEGFGIPIAQATKLGLPVFVNANADYIKQIEPFKYLHNIIKLDNLQDYDIIKQTLDNWTDEDKEITKEQYYKYFSIDVFKKTFINWYNSLDKKIIIYSNGGKDKVRLTPYTIQSHAFIEELKHYIKENNLNWEVINCETQSFKNDTNLYDTLAKYWRTGDILIMEDDKVFSIEIIQSLFNDVAEDVSHYFYGKQKEYEDMNSELGKVYSHDFKIYTSGFANGLTLIRLSAQNKTNINEIENHDYSELDKRLSDLLEKSNIRFHLLGFINHLHYMQWNRNNPNVQNEDNNIIYDEYEDEVISNKYKGQNIDDLFRNGHIDLKTYNKLKSLGLG